MSKFFSLFSLSLAPVLFGIITGGSEAGFAAKPAPAKNLVAKKSAKWVVEFPVLPRDAKNKSINAPDACDPGQKGLILKFRKKNRLWVCVTEESGMETTDKVPDASAKKSKKKPKRTEETGKEKSVIRHFHVDQGFKLFFKQDDGQIENLITEGEISNNPLDIVVSDDTVTLTSTFKSLSPKGVLTLRPFRDLRILCEDKSCTPLAPTCAFHLRKNDDRKAVQEFDAAARNFSRELKKKKDALKTKAFSFLDPMLLLAITGQKNARKRFQYFPLTVDGTAAEKIANYQDTLRLTNQLGCDVDAKKSKATKPAP